MAPGVIIARRVSMSIAMMRSTANIAGRLLMARGAIIRPRGSIGTDPARTSASGADRPPTAPGVTTARRVSTRNKKTLSLSLVRRMLRKMVRICYNIKRYVYA